VGLRTPCNLLAKPECFAHDKWITGTPTGLSVFEHSPAAAAEGLRPAGDVGHLGQSPSGGAGDRGGCAADNATHII
jgi:hypothetical protein